MVPSGVRRATRIGSTVLVCVAIVAGAAAQRPRQPPAVRTVQWGALPRALQSRGSTSLDRIEPALSAKAPLAPTHSTR